MTTLPQAPFYVPRPSDDFVWQRSLYHNLTLAVTPAAKPFATPPWVPRFDSGESFWQFAKRSNLPLSTARTIPFASSVWVPRFDSGESFWQYAKPYNLAIAASLQFPATRESFYVNPDDSPTWQYTFTNTLQLLQSKANTPFASDPWVPSFDSGESFWQGKPASSKTLVPLLTAGGQVKSKQWLFGYSDDAHWQIVLRYNNSIASITSKPLALPPWRFGYSDDSNWEAKPVGSRTLMPILTAGGQIKSKQWLFGYSDDAHWQIILRYNNSIASITPKPLNLPPWRFGYSDDSNWPGQPVRSGIIPMVTVGGQIKSKQWLFGLDDFSTWQWRLYQNVNLLAPVAPPVPKVLPPWRFGYSDDSFWQGKPVASNTLVPNLTTGQVKPFRWNFTLDDPPPWQVLLKVNLNVITLPPPKPPFFRPNLWNYGLSEDLDWQAFFPANYALHIVPTPSALDVDPRFICSPTAYIPSDSGAARVFVTTPTVIPQASSMPYGNDFSIIDPMVEQVTLTFNFAPWLDPGVTITSVLNIGVSVSVESLVSDPNPLAIITGSPVIISSPTSGAFNTAVLQQVEDCQPNVTYLLQCLVQTSDNQKLNLASHLPCSTLN